VHISYIDTPSRPCLLYTLVQMRVAVFYLHRHGPTPTHAQRPAALRGRAPRPSVSASAEATAGTAAAAAAFRLAPACPVYITERPLRRT
jgi:hypothetical protein